MNDNSFRIRLSQDVKSLLQSFNLYKKQNNLPSLQVSPEIRRLDQDGSQQKLLERLTDQEAYHFLLTDDSIFQFTKENESYRYLYIQNGKIKKSFEALFKEMFSEYDSPDEETLLKIRSLYDECEDDSVYHLLPNPVYLRYDCGGNTEIYKEAVHAYAHLHVGMCNSIRIPCSYVLTPELFTLFVIKMVYVDSWKLHMNDGYVQQAFLNAKRNLDRVPSAYWSLLDQKELFLS